ncbi:putative Peptidoglycan-binding LysM [[Clostridium] ultunense Esp]|uniref:Putative Peptidoglycan-binding LysM n=1 Tax=[Clostridium] ultunense Esp TaxID=1288971 RepID=M1ZBW5_9FIRM|nr:LysM domain-containing protein [Schnuerera ultunensis]CCQ95981.1 putative Peptidoglycan-binding LysM [[Clostridium] ultunense Esp]SHD77181.1 putative Peptidoglycan-binding LysM [[Clostridium] ultunense Esp]
MKKLNMKKMMRPLTKNEKILLLSLGIIIIFWATFRFVIEPQMTKLEELTNQKLEYEEEIAQMNSILKREKKIDEEWIKLQRAKDSILNRYFSTLDQPEIIYLLNELLDNEEINILDINFDTPSQEEIGDLSIRTMNITIPYRGSYKGFLETINGITSSPKKMVISNLTMDRDIGDNLAGNIGLKIYSLEGIADIDEEIDYINASIIEGKTNPFVAFEGFEKEGNLGEEGPIDDIIDDNNRSHIPSTEEEIMDNFHREVLETFEDGGLYFIPSHKNIRGRLSKSSNFKHRNYSLRLEYDILAIEDENRAYIDLTDRNIIIKYPPANLGLWVHSYAYSPATIGLRFKGQAGEKIGLELSKGVNWIGWNYLETKPPEDLSLYPLQLDRIYLELSYNRDDYGVILFDKLEANYPKDSIKTKEKFSFYIVEKGDTLNKISMKYYGTTKKKNVLIKYNEIESDKDIWEGKILVIPK